MYLKPQCAVCDYKEYVPEGSGHAHVCWSSTYIETPQSEDTHKLRP